MQPLPHQLEATRKAVEHYRDHDRGRMTMACGTGKTYASLLIAEAITPTDGYVLYLAPSIMLVSQALKEYQAEATDSYFYIVVCSDKKIGRRGSTDSFDTVDELPFPPTTDADTLTEILTPNRAQRKVILCTYQSLDVIHQSQQQGTPEIDLVVCDEAHRTIGILDQNYFTAIHKPDYVRAKKRLYMTATPRLARPANTKW